MKKIVALAVTLFGITYTSANPNVSKTPNVSFLNYTDLLMHIKLSWDDGVTRIADLPGKQLAAASNGYTGVTLGELPTGVCTISITREDPGIGARWLGSFVSKSRLLTCENQQGEMLSWKINLISKNLVFLLKDEAEKRLIKVSIRTLIPSNC